MIVDEELPYPPNSGKRIRTLSLILPLAARHHITYICHPSADDEETKAAVEFFHRHDIETVLVDRTLPGKSGARFYGRLFCNLFSPLPYTVQSHNDALLRRAIREYDATHKVDLWHCEWTPYGESVASFVRGPWIVMAHNVESLIWRRYFENESNPLKRWYIRQQLGKFERFERRIFSAASLTVAVSRTDARLMREQFGADRVDVVDNGVDTAYYQPNGAKRDPSRLLFLGSLDWRPNLDAIELLLGEVFPRVVAAVPSARLSIVGRKPPRRLVERVRSRPGVELHADVPDVRPFLHQCGLMVVPLRIGGGSRLKILEALAAECPVVSTRIGAEGLWLTPGLHFVQTETPGEMVDALIKHIHTPAPIQAMARAGRQVTAGCYDWSFLSAKLEAIWMEQVAVRDCRR